MTANIAAMGMDLIALVVASAALGINVWSAVLLARNNHWTRINNSRTDENTRALEANTKAMK